MQNLFNSHGEHIANVVNDQLHSTTGDNIGHYLEEYEIFTDMEGHYLGEIIHDNRLVCKKNSPYQNTNFGIRGDHGNIGKHGNPGNHGALSLPGGYEDVGLEKLGRS